MPDKIRHKNIPVKNIYAQQEFHRDSAGVYRRCMENLAMIRKSKGWTQEQLAEIAGVTQPTINRIEKGGDGVTLRTLKQIAKAVDVPLYALFMDSLSPAELNLIKASRGLSADVDAAWREKAAEALTPPRPTDQ